jgi:hypothetical protein
LPAGGRPATTYLSCFAKKGKPKKATAKSTTSRCPFGVPVCAGQKMGKRSNRFGLQQATLSDPFFALHKRQRLMRMENKKLKPTLIYFWSEF